MNAKRKARAGRPPLSSLEKAIRHALYTRRRYRELRDEYRAALAIDPGDSPELAAGKRQVADDRMEAARQIEKHRLKALATDSKETEARIRKKEKEARSELNALPPLGHSYGTWEALPEEERKRPVGKQPLPLDVKLHRAELEWDDAMKALEAEGKKAGIWPIDLDDYRDPVVHSKGIGRPPLDELGELDTKIRLLERWIDETKALPKSAFKPPPGKGRKPIPREKKIQRYQDRISKLEEQIKKAEKTLSPADKLRRERKLLMDERRQVLKARLKKVEREAKLEELDRAIEKLDQHLEREG